MAEDTGENQENEAKKSGLISLLIVAIVSVSAGIATPLLWDAFMTTEVAAKNEPELEEPEAPPVFIPFEDVTVNLDSTTLNRFLHVKIALQIKEKDQKEVEADLLARKQVLKDWLLGYLRDQKLEDIRGASGHNRLRRDIGDQINAMLYADGPEKIHRVLFEEFNVQ